MELLLAHDVGTTGNKASLFSVDGTLVASAVAPYHTYHEQPGWAEQRPADWWAAITSSTRDLLARCAVSPSSIVAIGVSGHMMGCLPVDDAGTPLRPSLIHSDVRSGGQCSELERRLGQDEVYRLTGNIVDPHYPLPKMMWLRENEPAIYAKTRFFLQAKDFAVFRLTGCLGLTDFSDSSLTGLLDITRRQWNPEIAAAAGVSMALLPDPVASTTRVGRVSARAAAETGLAQGTPVVAGAGDGGCATAGSGTARPGQAYNYVGGTSWLAALSRHPVLDATRRVFNWIDMDPTRCVAAGTVQSAGSAYAWAGDQFAPEETIQARADGVSRYPLMDELAAKSPPGASRLFFLPYLMGERSPIWDPLARAAFLGLTLSHSRSDLLRSVLEGVSFALGSILESIEDNVGRLDSIRLIGGGAGSALWREILAAVYDRPICLPANPGEATSWGAAIAAGVGAGVFSSVEEGALKGAVSRGPEVDSGLALLYRSHSRFYRSLYPALKQTFQLLAALE